MTDAVADRPERHPPTGPTPRRRSRTWFRGRAFSAGAHLDVFLVCAAVGVIFNRTFLILTGYPQIGTTTLHISHAIWGALAMMVALALYLAFLSPTLRGFVAVLGGFGFGWFVDELGKFISRDTDYLFQPALAVIYCVFIAMYFWFRYLVSRPYDADDAVINALVALQAARLGALRPSDRSLALDRLAALGDGSPLARDVRDLLAATPASPPLESSRIERGLAAGRRAYVRWTATSWFVPFVTTVFGLIAVSVLVSALTNRTVDGDYAFSSWIATAAAGLYTVLVLIGGVLLPRDRARAFRWFDRAVLIWILVIQVFLFDRDQFGATFGLLAALAVWALLRSAMAVEAARTTSAGPAGEDGLAGEDGPGSAVGSGATADRGGARP